MQKKRQINQEMTNKQILTARLIRKKFLTIKVKKI